MEVLNELYDDKVRHPASIIELSKSELKRFEHNTIHLTGLKHVQNFKQNTSSLPLYSHIKYGANINRRKKKSFFC